MLCIHFVNSLSWLSFFLSPFSENGLYINLSSFQAFGFDYLHSDALRTNSRVYLHSKFEQVPKDKENISLSSSEEEKGQQQVPTKLAIGVDGGFDLSPKYNVIKSFQLFVFIDLPTSDNQSSCKGKFVPLPFVQQSMAQDVPECIVHLDEDAAAGHAGVGVPEFVRNICLAVLNHDGMTSRMQVR